MKKISVFVLTCLIAIFSFSNILKFIPYDYDIFIHFKNENAKNKIKNVPFLRFVISDEGLGFENYLLSYLENTDYESGLNKEIFLKTLSSNILFLSKGGEINVDSSVSFDLNYYIDIIRNLSKDSAIIFETEDATLLTKYLGAILDEKVERNERLFVIGESLYACGFESYLIVAGSKAVVDYLISTYGEEDLEFVSVNPNIFSDLESDYWFLGYSKSDAIKINFPIESVRKDVKTEYILFVGKINNDVLSIRINQKTNKTYQKSTVVDDLMEEIPVLGNYFGGVSVMDTKEALEFVKPWIYTFDSTDVTKIYEITDIILSNATTTFYIVGDVDDATNVSLAFLVKLSDGLENISEVLEKYSIKYDKLNDEWIMKISNNINVYFYKYEQFFVISNIEKSIYERKARLKKLVDIAAYNYLDKKRSYDVKIFMDIGDLIYKSLGIGINSKLIFWQEKNGNFINYYLDIM